MTELAAAALVQRGITQLSGRSNSPRRDAEVLLQAACGIDRTGLAKNPDQPVDATAADAYFDFLDRRYDHEPVACILGRKEFWSLELELNASTLVPRPETELLVETALEAIPAGTAVELLTSVRAVARSRWRLRPNVRLPGSPRQTSTLMPFRRRATMHRAWVWQYTFRKATGLDPLRAGVLMSSSAIPPMSETMIRCFRRDRHCLSPRLPSLAARTVSPVSVPYVLPLKTT